VEFLEHKSNYQGIISTETYKGDLSRYLPTKGQFNYIHFDFAGKGGVCKVIEGKAKQNMALLALA
jgi:hypothetical protein